VRGSVAQRGVGPWRQGRMRFHERSSQGQTNHFGEAGRASPAETSGDQGQPLSDWCACTSVEPSGTAILGVSMRRLPLGVRECSLRAFDVSHEFNHQNRPAGDVFARLHVCCAFVKPLTRGGVGPQRVCRAGRPNRLEMSVFLVQLHADVDMAS
jgi:hypothetical protein